MISLDEAPNNNNNNNSWHHSIVVTVGLLASGQVLFLAAWLGTKHQCSPPLQNDTLLASTSSFLEGRDLICYGSQGPANAYADLKSRFEKELPTGTYAFFFHSFDKDCDGCIFQKGTALSEGKNLATKTAMTSPKWRSCKYWTFFDDDVELRKKNGNFTIEESWRDYHNMLLAPETTHPLIKAQDFARDRGDSTTMYQSCVDEHFLSFRFDYLSLFWPMTTRRKDNFWFNNQLFFTKMSKCYPAGIRVDHRYVSTNHAHRYSTNQTTYIFNASSQKEVLQDEIPGLGPWALARLYHRCDVQQSPSLDWHPKCAVILNRRLELWLRGMS